MSDLRGEASETDIVAILTVAFIALSPFIILFIIALVVPIP